MHGRPILVVVPTVEEFEFFLRRAESTNDPSMRLVHIPTTGSSAGVIRLSIEDQKYSVWLEVFIVCLHGKGRAVAEIFRRKLEDIRPHLVIVGGIAGGAANHDLSIGDIAVSDTVHSPLYTKKRPTGEQAVLDLKRGTLACHLATFGLFSDLSKRLTDYARNSHERPTEQVILEAVTNQSVADEERASAIDLAKKRFNHLFDASEPKGVSVAETETYSEPVNQKALESAFARSCKFNPALGIAEMEAQVLHDVMISSGRQDQPLIVKCISDVPGWLCSDPIKDLCRSLAAEALFGLFESPDFALALDQAEGNSLDRSIARSSFVRLSSSENLRGIANSDTLIQLTERPADFEDDDISRLANEISKDDRRAAAMVDILVHFAVVCPRCGRGAAELLRLKPIVEATLRRIAGVRSEIVRAGKLAGVAPLYGIEINELERLDWSLLVSDLRKSSQRESAKTALMGRVYELMSRDLREAVLFTQQLRRTGEFHDQSFATWFYTAAAAAVSRGDSIDRIRKQYPREWERYMPLYNARNPFSYDITTLIPLITGRASIDEIDGADGRLDRLANEVGKDYSEGSMGITERVIVTTALVSVGHQGIQWDEEASQHAMAMASLNYIPLAPIASIRSHVNDRSGLRDQDKTLV